MKSYERDALQQAKHDSYAARMLLESVTAARDTFKERVTKLEAELGRQRSQQWQLLTEIGALKRRINQLEEQLAHTEEQVIAKYMRRQPDDPHKERSLDL